MNDEAAYNERRASARGAWAAAPMWARPRPTYGAV